MPAGSKVTPTIISPLEASGGQKRDTNVPAGPANVAPFDDEVSEQQLHSIILSDL